MLEMPNDAITQFKTMLRKKWIHHDIQRDDLAMRNKISDLPANAAARRQDAGTLGNDERLPFQIAIQMHLSFIGLAKVVRRRGDDELHGLVGNGAEELLACPFENDGARSRVEACGDG